MNGIDHYLANPRLILAGILKKSACLWPDEVYLRMYYKMKTGERLNLRNPKTFNEKLQWLKLYDRKTEYTTMVDKIEAKKWVAERIGEEHIIPTLGVWGRAKDIDFDSLPNQFVLKTNHDSGGVVICKDKSTLDIKKARNKLNKSLNTNYYISSREWPYKKVPKRIIAEKYLEISGKSDLTDYKFFCFNGVPKFIQVIQDRNTKETIDFFDTEWNHMEFVGLNPKCSNAKETPTKPEDLYKMIKIAENLAKNTPFVRIDLYNIDSKIYFGELTFYPASGFGKFTPKEWSTKLGDYIQLFDNL